MAHDESQLREAYLKASRHKRRLRFVILLCFGLLGSMTTAVLLSHPVIATQIIAAATDLSSRPPPSPEIAVPAPGGYGVLPDARADTADGYTPINRIPVRSTAKDVSG